MWDGLLWVIGKSPSWTGRRGQACVCPGELAAVIPKPGFGQLKTVAIPFGKKRRH